MVGPISNRKRRRVPFDDFMRRVQRGIDPTPPCFTAVAGSGQLKIERFPIRIQNQMERQLLPREICVEGQAVRAGLQSG